MQPGQIIVLATPVFLLLIALEFVVGLVRERRGTGRNTYRLNDAVNSISLGMLSQISAVLTKLLRIGIYTAIFEHVALFHTRGRPESMAWLLCPASHTAWVLQTLMTCVLTNRACSNTGAAGSDSLAA